jgi:hypothetical protein
MPSGDIMKATIEGTFDGEPIVTGLGFVSASGEVDFAADAAGLAGALADTLGLADPGSAYLAPLSGGYVVNNVRIQDMAPGTAASLLFPQGGTGGNVADDAMPGLCCLCVTWRTGLKGKENRGRTYLTGFAEDSANAGYWIPEIQLWAQGEFANALLSRFGPLGTGDYVLSLIHTVSGGVRLIPPTATPIVSADVHNTVRSQRRRGVGVRISRRRTGP